MAALCRYSDLICLLRLRPVYLYDIEYCFFLNFLLSFFCTLCCFVYIFDVLIRRDNEPIADQSFTLRD